MLSYFSSIGLNAWALFAGIVGLLIAGIMINLVNKTVGLKFARQLFMMKKKMNRKKILLKVWLPNGKPEYIKVDAAGTIKYKYKENGQEKEGMVLYDHYAKYQEFSGIPVIECSPDDILPRNPFAKTSMTISPRVVMKNITDSAKETTDGDNMKKMLKMALPIVGVIGIIIILYASNQNETVATLTAELAKAYASCPKTATIIGG